MSASRVYFKGLRCGDFKQGVERLSLSHTAVDMKASVGGAEAHAHASGPSAYHEVETTVAFVRNADEVEGSSAFWDRIRVWQKTLKRALAYGSGVTQLGPLCFIRDPDGANFSTIGTTDEADSTTAVGAITGGGSEAVSLDTLPDGWEIGQFVLVLDPANPTTVYEVVEITDVDGVTDTITGVFVNAYPDGAEVHRIEWYLPNACLMNRVQVGGGGNVPRGFAKDIDLVFASNADHVNGGLAK